MPSKVTFWDLADYLGHSNLIQYSFSREDTQAKTTIISTANCVTRSYVSLEMTVTVSCLFISYKYKPLSDSSHLGHIDDHLLCARNIFFLSP